MNSDGGVLDCGFRKSKTPLPFSQWLDGP